MKITFNIIHKLFEQLSFAWLFASVSSSAGVSLNTSNQDHGGKMIRTTADMCYLTYMY